MIFIINKILALSQLLHNIKFKFSIKFKYSSHLKIVVKCISATITM